MADGAIAISLGASNRVWLGLVPLLFRPREFASIRGWVPRAFDINTNSGYGWGCSNWARQFSWVFLKVWLTRLISGF
jgi:hypothetical protein